MQTTERFEKVAVDHLVPYARNARTHSKEQIMQLRASLREYGFRRRGLSPLRGVRLGEGQLCHGPLAVPVAA